MEDTKAKEMDFFEKVGYTFSLIKPSWEAFKLNWSTFLLLWLIPFLLVMLLIPIFVLPSLNDSTFWNVTTAILAVLSVFGALFVNLLIWPAVISTQFASVNKKKINLDAALNNSKDVIFNFILAAIIGFFIIIGPLLVSIALLLLIVGLFLLPFALAWAFVAPFFLALFPYLIVDKKQGPIEAIMNSFLLVKANWQWVLSVWVVLFAISIAINVVGWVPIIGAIVGIGLSLAYFCMPVYVYLNHIKQPETATAKSSAKSKTSASPKTVKKTTAKKPAKKTKATKESNK